MPHVPEIAVRTRTSAGGSKRIFLDYRVDGRRYRETVGPDSRPIRKLAKDLVVKRQTEIVEGRFLGEVIEDVTFSDFAEEYMESYGENLKSKVRVKSCLKNLCSVFGEQLLSNIRTQDIERYKTRRQRVVTKSTVNRDLAILKAVFYKAIAWEKAAVNPVKGIKFFKEPKGRVKYLEDDEAEVLLKECDEILRPIVVIARNTGMRRSEIVAIQWKQIDLKTGFIRLDDGKSGEGRDVPLNQTATATFRSLRRRKGDETVFVSANGKPVKKDWVTRAFRKATTRVGLKDFRFHDLRHDAASKLVMNGVDIQTVQEILGHKTLAMTMRYSHLSPDHKLRAVRVLDAPKLVSVGT